MTSTTTVRRSPDGKIAGTERDDGRVSEVVRDKRGRIASVRGSRDPLLQMMAEELADVNERTQSLQQALEERTRSLEESLEERAALLRLAASTADNLERHMLHAEGWIESEGMYFSQRDLAEVRRRYGLRWPQTVRWHDRDDETVEPATALAWYSGFERDAGHILNVRRCLTRRQTREAILHELGHAVQYERLREKFNQVAAECRGSLEDEADALVARCADLEMVRDFRPLSPHAPPAPPQLAAGQP